MCLSIDMFISAIPTKSTARSHYKHIQCSSNLHLLLNSGLQFTFDHHCPKSLMIIYNLLFVLCSIIIVSLSAVLAGDVWSLPALLTRGLRRVALDEGTCGGCGRTYGTDSFPPVPSVAVWLACSDSEQSQTRNSASGVARALRAPVQRHVMGPPSNKEIHLLFTAMYRGPAGQWLTVGSHARW